MPDPAEPTRRRLLQALALAPALGVALPRSAWAEARAAGLISPEVCLLSPEVTEGPFYVDPKLVRSDITEGRPGLPMTLRLQVVTADCRPVKGARVDVWHCDAMGSYSGVANLGGGADTTGQTFLRGTQDTGEDGVARFRTIFPGWYRGRTTHVHYKVFLEDRTVLTSQIFFDDDRADAIFAAHAPYDARGQARDTRNADDGIARRAGDGAFCTLTETPGGVDAAMVVGIDPSAGSGGVLRRFFG